MSFSYDWLTGFVSVDPENENYEITNQDLYNNIDELSTQMITYIKSAMTNPDYDNQINASLNQIGQGLVIGAEQLDNINAITDDSEDELEFVGKCLGDVTDNQINDIITKYFEDSKNYYNNGETFMSAQQIGLIANQLCPGKDSSASPKKNSSIAL